MTNIIDIIKKVTCSQNLTIEEAQETFLMILKGGTTPAQIAAVLVALKMKGETVEEIAGAATVMRLKSEKINAPENTLDTCGTGGDNSGSLNISTAVAFVVAGCGVPVAKHGNRAISSRSGSADVLKELGVNINAEKSFMEQALFEAGICFMMAPKYHNAMRYVGDVRRDLGIRTIFNILGPLSNPANSAYQLLGVYSKELTEKMATALSILGSKRAWVVHGEDGLDEITTTGLTHVTELNEGNISSFAINPADYGIEIATTADLAGGDAVYNARELRALLLGKGRKAYKDIVILNSAAALVICGKAVDLHEAIQTATESLESGKANQALLKLVEISGLDRV